MYSPFFPIYFLISCCCFVHMVSRRCVIKFFCVRFSFVFFHFFFLLITSLRFTCFFFFLSESLLRERTQSLKDTPICWQKIVGVMCWQHRFLNFFTCFLPSLQFVTIIELLQQSPIFSGSTRTKQKMKTHTQKKKTKTQKGLPRRTNWYFSFLFFDWLIFGELSERETIPTKEENGKWQNNTHNEMLCFCLSTTIRTFFLSVNKKIVKISSFHQISSFFFFRCLRDSKPKQNKS